MSKLTDSLVDAIQSASEGKTKGYDTTATVVRIEGATAWVHIPGGVDETPVKLTINAKEGDTVQVRVSGGSAWLVGNATAPPTDDTTAETAYYIATDANELAESASKAASEAWGYAESAHSAASSAKTSADEAKAQAVTAGEYATRALGNLSTVQNITETLNWITAHGSMMPTQDQQLDPTHVYFIVDTGGDYVVGGTTYAVVTEPDVADIATYYELSIDESLQNYVGTHLALTNEGLYVLSDEGENNGWKVLIANDGVYIQDNTGATVAKYSDSITIGAGINYGTFSSTGFGYTINGGQSEVLAARLVAGATETQTITSNYNHQPYIASGSIWQQVGQIQLLPSIVSGSTITLSLTLTSPAGSGNVYTSTATFTAGTLGEVSKFEYIDENNYRHFIKFSYNGYYAIDIWTSYKWAFALQVGATFNIQPNRSAYFTFGSREPNEVIGNNSFSEGGRNIASGDFSHAEGFYSKAIGDYSHAENESKATGNYSHAEGYQSESKGIRSHAQGYGTIARGENQAALGKYNVEDTANAYAVIVGNGTGIYNRSNALTIDWDGDVLVAIDTTAASGTKDGDLYAAITALGWESEVIV